MPANDWINGKLMRKTPLVHIGMAKAASSFLQHEVFSKLDSVNYLGKHHVNDDLKFAGRALVRRISLNWDEGEWKKAFIEKMHSGAIESKPVYSEEDLSVFKFLDPEVCARRLRSILGVYNVLLVVRHPLTWLASQYLFRLSNLEQTAVLGFDEWFEYHMSVPVIGSDVAELRFARLASIYREISGGEVFIVPYELLKHDKHKLAELLGNALECGADEVYERISIQQSKETKSKPRIAEVQREFYELAKWVLFRNQNKFFDAFQQYKDKWKLDLPEDIMTDFDTAFKNGDFKLGKWRAIFARATNHIAVKQESLVAAQIQFNAEQQQLVSSILLPQLRHFTNEFGYSLNELGIEYKSDGVHGVSS